MSTRKDLSNVMRRAWAIYRKTGKTFAVCLSKAWALYRLVKRMRDGIVSFAYEKTDGSLRRAKGTLKEVAALIKGTGTDTPTTLRYYDVEASGFRSFRVENLVTVY